MTRAQTLDFALIAAGLGLWLAGARSFADYHDAVAAAGHEDFVGKHHAGLATAATAAGLALAVAGVYRVNPTWGTAFGVGLTGLVAYNAVKHKQGEPLISLSPFRAPAALLG